MIRDRVDRARQMQLQRFRGGKICCNVPKGRAT
jgi:hypothetical protein